MIDSFEEEQGKKTVRSNFMLTEEEGN